MKNNNNSKVSSRPGLFGTVNHYNEKGEKIGESRPGFFGVTNHYDANGRKTGSSMKGAFGWSLHYDAKGNRSGTSYEGFFGTSHYDNKGNHIGNTYSGVFGNRHSILDSDQDFNKIPSENLPLQIALLQGERENDVYSENTFDDGNAGSVNTNKSKIVKSNNGNSREWVNLKTGTFLWRVFAIVLFLFTTITALTNMAVLFSLGDCNTEETIVCTVISVILIFVFRGWRKKQL